MFRISDPTLVVSSVGTFLVRDNNPPSCSTPVMVRGAIRDGDMIKIIGTYSILILLLTIIIFYNTYSVKWRVR